MRRRATSGGSSRPARRVAICDQVSEPKPGQIVQREVTHIVSPGTIADLQMLDAKRNNFLAAIHPRKKWRARLRIHRSHDRRFSPHRTGGRQGTRRRTRPRAARRGARGRGERGALTATRDASSRARATRSSPTRRTTRCANISACSRSMVSAAPKCPPRKVRGGRDLAIPQGTAPLAEATSRGSRCIGIRSS